MKYISETGLEEPHVFQYNEITCTDSNYDKCFDMQFNCNCTGCTGFETKAFLKKDIDIDGVVLKCSYSGHFEHDSSEKIRITYPCIPVGKYKDAVFVSTTYYYSQILISYL